MARPKPNKNDKRSRAFPLKCLLQFSAKPQSQHQALAKLGIHVISGLTWSSALKKSLQAALSALQMAAVHGLLSCSGPCQKTKPYDAVKYSSSGVDERPGPFYNYRTIPHVSSTNLRKELRKTRTIQEKKKKISQTGKFDTPKKITRARAHGRGTMCP